MDPSNTICLFDIDGTLTKSRNDIKREMHDCLEALKSKVTVGLVGGSDLGKIADQLELSDQKSASAKEAADRLIARFDYVFAENGLVAYKKGERLPTDTIISFMGEEKLQKLINFSLKYMSELTLPCKRGNFIEFRTGLINICPTGRSCTQAERDQFAAHDATHQIRKKFVAALEQEFGDDYGLSFALGGQISIDVFPRGWDKTYCLKFVSQFKNVYFFGDKTDAGGNDHEIYSDERTIGHSTTSPDHTKQILTELFF